MFNYNNMKEIREIYGATQEEISKIAGVNRSTVSQWETGATKASNSKLEKLSIFYGIGPECFYELEKIDDIRKNMLLKSSEKEREMKNSSNRNKAVELSKILETLTFEEAMVNFMHSMKIMLALSDDGRLNDLKTAYEINQKMGVRLNAIIEIRDTEEKLKIKDSSKTLFELLDSFNEE